MHKFFYPTGESIGPPPPRRAFARLDYTEPSDPADAEEVVIGLEAVDADWIEREDQIFNPLQPEHTRRYFQNYWASMFAGSGLPRDGREYPFGRMPLHHIEITLKGFEEPRNLLLGPAAVDAWFYLEQSDAGTEADTYGNLFVDPTPTKYAVSRMSIQAASVLRAAFEMDLWPDTPVDEIERTIQKAATMGGCADHLAIYDIGQGSASALLGSNYAPWLYYDMGAGVYRNHHTTPLPLAFCHTTHAPILLSHWDADHWAGARHDTKSLQHIWIAPRQSLGPIHVAFANDILAAGGRLLIWGDNNSLISVNAGSQDLTISRGTGRGRNGTGIAVTVVDRPSGQAWVLTGDLGYHEFGHIIPPDVVATIAPHHGATMHANSIAPVRTNRPYARVVYSYGPGNAHGRTSIQHPTSVGVQTHASQNWDHGSWNGVQVAGITVPGSDALATAVHVATHLQSAVVSWQGPRPALAPPCTSRIAQRQPAQCPFLVQS